MQKQHAQAVTLVEFRVEQIEELVNMWRESFEWGVGVVDPHPIEEQRDHFVSAVVSNNSVRIALLDDGWSVSSQQRRSRSHIYTCAKDTIGSVSAPRLLAWAKAQSNGRLWLYAFARNAIARAFYEKNGFELVARGFEPVWRLDDVKYEWSTKRSDDACVSVR